MSIQKSSNHIAKWLRRDIHFQSVLYPETASTLLGLAICSTYLLLASRWRAIIQRYVLAITLLPLALFRETSEHLRRFWRRIYPALSGSAIFTTGVNETRFPDCSYFHEVVRKLESSGLRSTGSSAHEQFVGWVKNELACIPGLSITFDEFEILRWETVNGRNLKEAGSLTLLQGAHKTQVEIAGAVPYSRPSPAATGKLIFMDQKQSLSSSMVKGKIVVREVPEQSLLIGLARLPLYSATPDLRFDYFDSYNRPSFWEIPLHKDLIDAGVHGAAGIVFVSDLPRAQLESYWDPHQGTHYKVPAVFCGSEDRVNLKEAAKQGLDATIAVHAHISKATTANVYATLPGQIEETVVYATHTDGNTCIQDNGVAALLTLAQYFASQPISSRRRTLQFAFNTAHLHVSKEGSGLHSLKLDERYDKDGTLALVIPVEHLGPREIEARPNPGNDGRTLHYTGLGERMIWCVGPSPPLVAAVEDAVKRRKLDRVLVTRGVGIPRLSKVPTFNSFGGLGTLYHNALLPTTSIISGPWSLFAPSFGAGAVDVDRMRKQTLALGDIYLAVEGLTREQIAGGYSRYRQLRHQKGKKVYDGFTFPPETLDGDGASS